jgi:signal transduction histidine kinase
MTTEHDGTKYAQLSVADDGDGVPADMRHTIFERFSRLDEARSRDRGGAGLGLSLVQAIVARHGGTITVDDAPELAGARFTIHFPLAPVS